MRSWLGAGLLAAVGLAAILGAPGAAAAQTARACAPKGVLTRVEVPGKPFGVEASPDGCWVFVSLAKAEGSKPGVAVLHAEAGGFKLARVVPMEDQAGGVARSHDGRLLAVASFEAVLIYDAAKLESGAGDALLARVPLGAGGIEAAFARDDKLLFVTEERRARLAVLDVAAALAGASGASPIRSHIPLGRAPVGLALSPDGSRLYVTSEIAGDNANLPARCTPPESRQHSVAPGILQVIDTAQAVSAPDKASLAVMVAGCGPVRVALSPDGRAAWVTARSDDALEVFELGGPGDHPASRTVKVGSAPVGVAVRPDGAQVWVADSDRFDSKAAGKLTLLTLGAQATLREINVAGFPRELKFLPDGVTLAVSEFRGQSVAFIATDRLPK